jgi:hypothetical protein
MKKANIHGASVVRSMWKLAASLGLALIVTTASIDVAHATSFAELTVEDMTDASSSIIQGSVLEVWTELGEGGRVWTRARVRVDQQLKGVGLPDEIVVDTLGGTVGDLTMTVHGSPRFSKGEQLFLFLDRNDGGRFMVVSKYLGKFTLRRASGEKRLHAMTWQSNNAIPFDHRFLPHPKIDNRVYFDDLVDRVQERLTTGWAGKAIPGVSPEELERRNTPENRQVR